MANHNGLFNVWKTTVPFKTTEPHLESFGIEHFGVFGEVHLHGAILVHSHCHFFQRPIPTVRTEDFIHVTGRSETYERMTVTKGGQQFIFDMVLMKDKRFFHC